MRRSDQEPLLFDLPLDRPARDKAADDIPEPDGRRGNRGSQRTRDARDARGERATGRGQASFDDDDPADRMDRPVRGDRPDRNERNERGTGQRDRGNAASDRNQPQPAAGRNRTLAAAPPPAGQEESDPASDGTRGMGGVGRRLASGAADLLVHAAVGILTFAGCRYLGVYPTLHDWPAGAVFLIAFSFLYTVIPLAFWGHTLGMTWAGLTAQSTEGEPLSFDQTARRWLGALLTLATLGLPTLLALTGRSLADRLSASETTLTAPTAR